MRNKITKIIPGILLLLLTPIVASATGIQEGFTLLVDRSPILSTLGFSFIPPGGTDWHERFGEAGITYLKYSNPNNISFYTGIVEGKMRTAITNKDELVKFVKAKKDQWGNDKERYQNITTKFAAAENIGPLCISYELFAEDHKAQNIGANNFLILKTNGMYCLHPNNTKNAVDIYYSARYMPSLDFNDLTQEGESYLNSLSFISIQGE